MAYAPQTDGPERVPVPIVVDHVQRRLLNAGRILDSGGWLVLTYTIGSNRAANAEHAVVGLLLLLLGVSLIMLSFVASQFPRAAGAGAAAADAVLFYFLAPAN